MGSMRTRRISREPGQEPRHPRHAGATFAFVTIALALVVLACVTDEGNSRHDGPPSRPPGAYPAAPTQQRGSPAQTTRTRGPTARATLIASIGETVTTLISDPQRRALYIGTRSGRILRLPIKYVSGSWAPVTEGWSTALDLRESVSTDGERGLLDMALLQSGDRVAASYTARDGSVVLQVFRFDGVSFIDDLPDPVVFRIPHPIAGHNGGGLALAEDGQLFVSLGDMDSRHYDVPLAQDPGSALGGVLRIPAAVLASDGMRPINPPDALVAKGLRNPWRIALDDQENALLIGDVGENRWEEVNRMSTATAGDVVDFGWPNFEGSERFQQPVAAAASQPVPPVLKYSHSPNRCAIVVGPVYQGSALPDLRRSLLLGDFCSGDVLAARIGDNSIDAPRQVTSIDGRIISFAEDANGETYVLTSDGDVYRLDPARWNVPDAPKTPEKLATDTTAAATTEPPPEAECNVATGILAVRYFASLSPTEMQSRLTNLIGSLEVAVANAPSSRGEHLSTLLRIFRQVEHVAQESGFRGSDPAVRKLVDEVLAGRGWSTGFNEAVNSVMSVQPQCT